MEYQVRLRVTGYLNVIVEGEDEEDARETALSLMTDELVFDDMNDIEIEAEDLEEC